MEVLLLVGAIVILGIWTGWQEYRLNKIREELDDGRKLLRKHDNSIYGERYFHDFVGIGARRENGVFYRLGVIERKLRTAEDRERVAHRKAEMKEYLGNGANDDDIDKLFDMAHGFTTAETECEEEEE